MKRQIAAIAALGGFINIASGALENAELVSGSWCFTYLSTYLEPIPIGTARPRPSIDSDPESLVPGQETFIVDPEDLSANETSQLRPLPCRQLKEGKIRISQSSHLLTRAPQRLLRTNEGLPSIFETASSSTEEEQNPELTEPISQPTSVTVGTPTTTASTEPGPAGQRVIFLVTPFRDTTKRELNGFVGDGNPDVCTFAKVFTLGSSQLFENDTPIYYLGDAFQKLQSLPSPPDGAIAEAFANAGGILQFRNSALPNGEAAFCQDTSDGEVYMTFSSQPSGCIPVTLAIYGVEQCVNGRLVGFDDSSTASSQSTSARNTESSISSIDDAEETESTEPSTTDTFSPAPSKQTQSRSTESLPEQATSEEPSEPSTFAPQPTDGEGNPIPTDAPTNNPTRTPQRPTFTKSSWTNSSRSSIDEISSETETEPVDSATTSFLPVDETSSQTDISSETESSSQTEILSETEIPAIDSTTSVLSTFDETSSSTETSSIESTSVQTSETSETSSADSTSTESSGTLTPEPTDTPTTTTTETSTSTEDDGGVVITNDIFNGRFAVSDPNSDSGLFSFEPEGGATQQNGDCYRDDGSPDDGCAALIAGTDPRKRVSNSRAGIWQMLNSLRPSSTILYTVQFYYAVMTAGGSQTCTVTATLGNRQFYSNSLFTSGGVGVSWNRVLTSVTADSRSANFGISMICMGNGQAMIYVDSVFISNQVTPENIDKFQLDFGSGAPVNPATTSSRSSSTSRSSSSPSSSTPIVPKDTTSTHMWLPTTTTDTEPGINTPQPTHATPSRVPVPSQRVCPPGYNPPGFCGQAWPTPTAPICERRGQPETIPVLYPLEDYPYQGLDIQKCALQCAYIDGCSAFAVNPSQPNYPCRFLWKPLGELQWKANPSPANNLEWSDLDCFNCQLCDEKPAIEQTSSDTSSEWIPQPDTSSNGENSQATPIHTPTRSWIPDPDPTDVEENSTPTPTPTRKRESTTTSDAPAESSTEAETCKYTHGEECSFDRFNYPQDALCAYGALFNGETWRESRTNYPHQDNPYQCMAICKGMENCQSVGYWQNENRCLFTSKRITRDDFTIYQGWELSWKHAYWVDIRCWTCPDCIPESVPNTAPTKCSYSQGDACVRNADPGGGVVCDTNAYMGGGYWTGDQWIDQYPHQDSPEACAAICNGIHDCKGSAFKDGRCKFSAFKLSFTDGPIPLEVRGDAENSLWDDPLCFTCPGCTD
ncbi:hypothetical protein NM208_g5758 [Fusarium decemcellulare]|uniref:Uncharacterized protein n=1 Tax=Fusarium decemcellulare TaxID=57161 RepID=A0ACC1SFU5_9HYPO|nr:hypothetical protein NM208_g5758 [Fusarium decemcellulare]